jgi:hypothetical protein
MRSLLLLTIQWPNGRGRLINTRWRIAVRRGVVIRSRCAFIRGTGARCGDVHLLGLEDRVDGGGVLAVWVAQQEAERVEALWFGCR